MPRPVDLDRVLAVEIAPGEVARIVGMIDHEDRVAKVQGGSLHPEGTAPSARRVG